MKNRILAATLILLALGTLPSCSNSPALPEACSQLPESGRCRASHMRWWYDSKFNNCRAFVWGGCGGSVPFETLEDCHAQCMAGQPLPETEPPVTAPPAAPAQAAGDTP